MTYPDAPGQTLPNGAILLAEHVFKDEFKDNPRESFVLAIMPGTAMPFVTWRRSVYTKAPNATGGVHTVDQTWSGEYYRRLDSAMQDYNRRKEVQ